MSAMAKSDSTHSSNSIQHNDDISLSDLSVGTWSKICTKCSKPNTISVHHCTGCSHNLTNKDIKRVSDNVFLDLIKGVDIGAIVRHRDDKIIVIDDKFAVSDNHIDIIPTQHIQDIKHLNASHIPLLQSLYQAGEAELRRRNLHFFKSEFISSGFNEPVSVKQLHLHMVLPPFRHEKIMQKGRWYEYNKIMNDLTRYGRVRLYDEYDKECSEGEAAYNKVIASWKQVDQLIEQNQNNAKQQPHR